MEIMGKSRILNFSSPRYSIDVIFDIEQKFGLEKCMITGGAGDLLLADVRGIHTGSPILKGERVAIFNYYIGEKWSMSESEIDKLDEATKNKFKKELS